MAKYTAWMDGVGEVCLMEGEASSHKEFRNQVMRRIVIRKGLSHDEAQKI